MDKIGRKHFVTAEKRLSKLELVRIRSHTRSYIWWDPEIIKRGLGRTKDRIVPPPEKRAELVREKHSEMRHRGVNTLQEYILRDYWVAGVKSTVSKEVSACLICQRENEVFGNQPQMQSTKVFTAFHTIGVDLKGALPKVEGYKHIMVAIHYCTKWVETEPLRSTRAEEAARAFSKLIISRCGPPRTMVHDGAGTFNDVFADQLTYWGIKSQRTAPYSPQANGLVERFNSEIM